MKCPRVAAPLLGHDNPDDPIFWSRGQPIARGTMMRGARHVARFLQGAFPQGRGSHVINLCEDRERFAEALLGAVIAGLNTLLPPNRSARAIGQLREQWPQAVLLDDEIVCSIPRASPLDAARFDVDPEFEAITLFTSGSTGSPQPHRKRWGSLMRGAELLLNRLDSMADGFQKAHMVATVPPQHMFGLETSVLLPLHSGISVHAGRPFYPADIAAALGDVPSPCILVTSPLHLRACVESGIEWPGLSFILSATDVLTPDMASRAEQTLGAPVFEAYGSTETGAIATRRTVDNDPAWHVLEGIRLRQEGADVWVDAAHIGAVALNDRVRIEGAGRLSLLGRKGDLINVAGKRGSLADLNHKLRGIDGVLDGVVFLPEPGGRLAGLVVAPGLSTREILEAMAKDVDPVFLPRPLHKVEALPRTGTGKLAHQDLLRLLEQCRGRG